MPSVWSTYTAAPHRVLFLPGAVQVVLVMLWWLLDMHLRAAGGSGLSAGGLPGPALHVWWMLYGCLPFFIFGFLFTAMPNWLNGPAIPRAAYVASGLAMSLGVLGVYLGGVLPAALSAGLALHAAGWAVAALALGRTLLRAPPQDKLHSAFAVAAIVLGWLGNLAFLTLLAADWTPGLAIANALGVWGFLTPTFLVVCHRMIPWFTSRVVPNYVMLRPYAPLGLLLTGCLLRGGLELAGRAELAWPVDLLMVFLVWRFSAWWGLSRGIRQVWLLAMLHIAFLWSGVAFALYGLGSLAAFAGWDWSLGQAPLHALGIGFFASMLIAMASRVSLGHSGRALQADALTWGLFWSMQVAALTRVLPDLVPALPRWPIEAAGLLWLLGFAVWAWRYAPMYWRPRVDGKSG
ncbi:MAG: NnrS family protein [Thiobacillaceae bacterium]|nr:NnrS family protein [Thiobacillaceae bacterium]